MQIGSAQWKRFLQKGARQMGVEIAPEKLDVFAAYAEELIFWTRKVNLTTLTAPEEIAVKHFLDSIAPVEMIAPDASLLDIGSGAGFPGIPLKILLPDLSVYLVESSRKKANFLRHIIRKLRLEASQVIEDRAEQLRVETQFRVIVSRAVSDLLRLIELGWPLLASGGAIIAYKGKQIKMEIEAARSFLLGKSSGFKAADQRWSLVTKTYRLPFFELERSLVVIRRL
ncbi:MAG: 16S rRNA (guanine(527)-N(7))-methyltransferase RsmG [Deltaproteobacteria bacterium]|nr:16S rRNA (guanine(527)-N(7))-methyltransferase RsmG [Deltaproteobacteria bacterium]MBW1961769.1 16S rRNA (guanine(527)-N(7))-methyltransferase RsmG [Deltaproteobacteria bacterium]